MTEHRPDDTRGEVCLSADSLRLRAIIGLGSSNQMTFNVHRPLTLIGSSPNCHIRIEGDTVCDYHCTIINTGSAILIRDLLTPTGMLQNSDLVSLNVIRDGDVLRIGPTPVHVAVRDPKSMRKRRPSGETHIEPRILPQPVRCVSPDGKETRFTASVAVVGSRRCADLLVDDPDAEAVHAVLHLCNSELAVTDLFTRSGTWINEQRVTPNTPSRIRFGDTLRIGGNTWTFVESDALSASATRTGPARVTVPSLPVPNQHHPVATVAPGQDDLDQRIEALQQSIRTLSMRFRH